MKEIAINGDIEVDLGGVLRRGVDLDPASEGALESLDVVIEPEGGILVDQEGRDLARLQDQGRLVGRQETCRPGLDELETDSRAVREGAHFGLHGMDSMVHRIRYGAWMHTGVCRSRELCA
eukprot:scaffold8588_cov63-Phaeocystis_antarctica.AAC.4